MIEPMKKNERKKKNNTVRRAKRGISLYPELEKHVRKWYANRIRDGDTKKYHVKKERKTGISDSF